MNFIVPVQFIFDQAPVFLLVLFRVGGIMATAPVFSSMVIPIPIRAMFALVIALAVFPLVPPVAALPNTIPSLIVAVALEMLIGITMGFALSLIFIGIELGAEMVSHQMGLAMANLVDPMTQNSTQVLSQFYTLLATVIFILLNGHVKLLISLLDTFGTIPLMAVKMTRDTLDIIVSILNGSFMLAIRVAGPALIAIFLATLALGFISRTMPQLNILAAGFPIRILLALVLLIASLGVVFVLFEQNLVVVFRQLPELFIKG